MGSRRVSRPLVLWSPHKCSDNEFAVALESKVYIMKLVSVESDYVDSEMRHGDRLDSDIGNSIGYSTGSESDRKLRSGSYAGYIHRRMKSGSSVPMGGENELPLPVFGAPSIQSFHISPVSVLSHKLPIRCMDWYPHPIQAPLMATGGVNGVIRLSWLKDGSDGEANESVCETFYDNVPAHKRCNNALKWSRNDSNLLASAFDKHHSDNCVVVWDTERFLSTDPSESMVSKNIVCPFQAGFAEGAVELSWVPSKPKCVAVGSASKWLRIYDIRSAPTDQRVLSTVAHAKSVRGVRFDPSLPTTVATFSEDQIRTWDIRKFDRVVASVTCRKPVVEIEWSPMRSGILASIGVGEKAINLWNVRSFNANMANSETSECSVDSESVLKANPRLADSHISRSDRNPAVCELPLNESRVLETPNRGQRLVDERINDPDIDKSIESPAISIDKPDSRRLTHLHPSSFCWIPPSTHCYFNGSQAGPNGFYGVTQSATRVMAVSWSGELLDVSVQDALPLALSCRSEVAVGVNSSLIECTYGDCDPARVMRFRAMVGYALNWSRNIDIFSSAIQVANLVANNGSVSEADGCESKGDKLGSTSRYWWQNRKLCLSDLDVIDYMDETLNCANLIRIRNLWRWIQRVSKCDSDRFTDGLVHIGLAKVLSGRSSKESLKSPERVDCRFRIHRSQQRKLALALCGWRDFEMKEEDFDFRIPDGLLVSETDIKLAAQRKTNLSKYISEAGNFISFERLVLLAVFFCDLPSAVQILRAASDQMLAEQNAQNTENGSVDCHNLEAYTEIRHEISIRLGDRGRVGQKRAWEHANGNIDAEAPNLLQLVAMAMAGYPNAASDDASGLWLHSCTSLLDRLQRFPVLRACVIFLMENFQRIQQQGQTSYSGSQFSPKNEVEGSCPDELKTEFRKKNSTVKSEIFSAVTEEKAIALGDRIAFACRFLPEDQLFGFLDRIQKEALDLGHIDALISTGLGDSGIQLLQKYVDSTGDIQTAVLLSCRISRSFLSSAESATVRRWVLDYRDLLNVWRLWQERAKFDVAFSEMQRLGLSRSKKKTSSDADTVSTAAPSLTALGMKSATSLDTKVVGHRLSSRLRRADAALSPTSIAVDPLQADESVLERPLVLSVVAENPQLYVICSQCKESLLLSKLLELPVHSNPRAKDGSSSTKAVTNHRKLTLPCCPHCRKPLPSCAVCALPMSCINPYAQMAGQSQADRMRISRLLKNVPEKVINGSDSSSPNGRAGLGSQKDSAFLPCSTAKPYGRWFSWCLRCRHGGHAACLGEWFAGHQVCPVSDCNCLCNSE